MDETAVLDDVTTLGDTGESDGAYDGTTIPGDAEDDRDDDSSDEGESESDTESDSGAESDESEGDKETVAPDGRKMPDAIKKSFAALKAVNPDAAKELKGIYWANQDYRATFPTVAEATAAKGLIDEIGGPEGVQQIAAEREEWGTLDKQYAEGSGEFIKSIAESNPEAFVKMAPQAINEWASRAPEQYAFYQDSVAYNKIMSEPGVKEGLENLYKLYSQVDGAPWAQAAIASVINGVIGLKDRSTSFQQKQQSVDPERQKFQQEKQSFEQQRRGSFEEGIAKQAESYLAEKMKPEVERILGGRKIDDEAAGTIQNLVKQEVQKRMAEIPGFADKLEAFYRTGDAEKSIDYIKAQYNRLLPEATKKVVAPLYRNIQTTPAKKPATKTGAPAIRAEVTLSDMPEWSNIDFTKCTTADVASGWAILKSGKKASGWL